MHWRYQREQRRYWCPIKSATKPKFYHSWYKDFADYGNPHEWKEKAQKKEAFISKDQDTFGMKQQTALEILKSGKNVFLTGSAGSGKNTYAQCLYSFFAFPRELMSL
jgi:transcriptional regulator with AAA-type ATPase domain